METAFRSFMHSLADLTALIGTGADDTHPFRWYALVAPQHTVSPLVLFSAETPPLEESYDQAGQYDVAVTTLDLEVRAVTYDETLAIWLIIRRAVRLFHKTKANTPQGTLAGIPVQSMLVKNGPTDKYLLPEDAGKQGFHVREASIEIIHREED